MTSKLLRGFAYVWTCLAFTFISVNLAVIWYTEGFGMVQEILNPFNVINTLVTIITLSPAIGAYMLAEKLDRKKAKMPLGSDLG